jgi:hypothetical protein
MANTTLGLTTLDFNTLKDSFKTYLKSQEKYKDYDFESSNFNVLLDVLSYNTYMNSFYLNMVNSEMFLDSAQLRNSIISHAKELNYLPRSKRSAKATLDLEIPTFGIDTFTIPKGTRFNASSGYDNYVFTTEEAITYRSSNNYFVISNLDVYEGNYVDPADTFVMDYRKENPIFTLSNVGVDAESVNVLVSEDNGVTYTEYTYAETLFNLTNQSKVFFIQGADDNKYSIFFGDNVMSYKPADGSIVVVTYRVSSGLIPTGTYNFNLDDDLASFNEGNYGEGGITITVVDQPTGGSDEESNESIRFNAPRHFQTQERAITNDDYRILVLNNFPEVKAVNVYGGESVTDTVQFGKVFIIPSTFSGTTLTDSKKADIVEFLTNRSSLSIEPVIINPDYLYVTLNTKVYVDFSSTVYSGVQIENLVRSAIITYNDDYLEDFNVAFRYSRLTESILDSTDGIISTESVFLMKKITTPVLNQSFVTSFSFNNQVDSNEPVQSSRFSSAGKTYYITNQVIDPTTNNILDLSPNTLYKVEVTASGVLVYETAGTINYITGDVSLNSMIINSYQNNPGLVFTAKSLSEDIYSRKNDIILINTSTDLNVEIIDYNNQ